MKIRSFLHKSEQCPNTPKLSGYLIYILIDTYLYSHKPFYMTPCRDALYKVSRSLFSIRQVAWSDFLCHESCPGHVWKTIIIRRHCDFLLQDKLMWKRSCFIMKTYSSQSCTNMKAYTFGYSRPCRISYICDIDQGYRVCFPLQKTKRNKNSSKELEIFLGPPIVLLMLWTFVLMYGLRTQRGSPWILNLYEVNVAQKNNRCVWFRLL